MNNSEEQEAFEKQKAEVLKNADEIIKEADDDIQYIRTTVAKIESEQAAMKEGVRKMIISNERSVRKLNRMIKAKKKRNKRRRF